MDNNEKGLRLQYQRDTGLKALRQFEADLKIPDIADRTIDELKDPITFILDPEDYEDEIGYISWLEEKLIAARKDPFLIAPPHAGYV